MAKKAKKQSRIYTVANLALRRAYHMGQRNAAALLRLAEDYEEFGGEAGARIAAAIKKDVVAMKNKPDEQN